MGVQVGFGVHISSHFPRTVIAFGAWSQIGCSPCRESARLVKVKKSREVRANACLQRVFAWVFKGEEQFGSARCMEKSAWRFWPRLPGWLPGSCIHLPVVSLDRHLLSPVETLSFFSLGEESC